MSQLIVYIDRSDILEGKAEELKRGVEELVDFVHAHEPKLIFYGFFFNEEGTRMTVVAVHPDAASLEFHMEIAGPAFRKLAGFIRLVSIEVFGRVSEKAKEQLNQKIQMLGEGGNLALRESWAGFARL